MSHRHVVQRGDRAEIYPLSENTASLLRLPQALMWEVYSYVASFYIEDVLAYLALHKLVVLAERTTAVQDATIVRYLRHLKINIRKDWALANHTNVALACSEKLADRRRACSPVLRTSLPHCSKRALACSRVYYAHCARKAQKSRLSLDTIASDINVICACARLVAQYEDSVQDVLVDPMPPSKAIDKHVSHLRHASRWPLRSHRRKCIGQHDVLPDHLDVARRHEHINTMWTHCQLALGLLGKI